MVRERVAAPDGVGVGRARHGNHSSAERAWFETGLVRPLAGSLGIGHRADARVGCSSGVRRAPRVDRRCAQRGSEGDRCIGPYSDRHGRSHPRAEAPSDVAWQAGRTDAQSVLDGLARTMSSAGGLATTFLGPLALLFGMIGLLVTTVVLFS